MRSCKNLQMKKEMIKITIVKEEIMSNHMSHRWIVIKRVMKMMENLILYLATLTMIRMMMMKIKRMEMEMRMLRITIK